MAFERWRVWALGAIGTASLLYVLATQTAADVGDPPTGRLVWPLLGVLPLFGLGLWLTHVSSNRLALYVLGSSTATTVSTAFEAYIVTNPGAVDADGFALVSAGQQTADVLAGILGGYMIATFPKGTVDRPWQRRVLRLVWVALVIPPATLFVSPTVLVSPWMQIDGPANPYAVPSLAWALPVVEWLAPIGWGTVGVGVVVLLSRALGGDPRTRVTLRYMVWTFVAAVAAYAGFPLLGLLGLPERHPLAVGHAVLVYVVMFAIPVAFVHGVLQYGAFDVSPDERALVVMRSASFLVAILYAAAVAAPAALVAWRASPAVLIVVTVLMALALQPLRAWLLERIRRRVWGDRAKQLALLTSLGTQLERTASLDEVLDQLAAAVREGLSASWVRLRLLDDGGNWVVAPRGESLSPGSTVSGDAVLGHDLVRSGRAIGRIELGPRHVGDYSPHELDLLATVARQATTAVANVHLTAQLEDQLAELTASRERLLSAQDEERRRIERDLHDGIQQDVVALIASLRLARNRLGRGDLEPDDLAGLQDQAREMLADLRELAQGIHPQVLTDNGLVAAIESRTARFPIPLSIEAEEDVRGRRFEPDVEAVAFFTVREALTNVAKHAAASRASVTLSTTPKGLRVVVTDDGRGFVPVHLDGAHGSHGGLSNIRDRVAAVGGSIAVDTGPAGGTSVTAVLPSSERVPRA